MPRCPTTPPTPHTHLPHTLISHPTLSPSPCAHPNTEHRTSRGLHACSPCTQARAALLAASEGCIPWQEYGRLLSASSSHSFVTALAEAVAGLVGEVGVVFLGWPHCTRHAGGWGGGQQRMYWASQQPL